MIARGGISDEVRSLMWRWRTGILTTPLSIKNPGAWWFVLAWIDLQYYIFPLLKRFGVFELLMIFNAVNDRHRHDYFPGLCIGLRLWPVSSKILIGRYVLNAAMMTAIPVGTMKSNKHRRTTWIHVKSSTCKVWQTNLSHQLSHRWTFWLTKHKKTLDLQCRWTPWI